jgi:hypothetical protein
MGQPRDPLSVRYDGVVGQVMRRAALASRQRKHVTMWIASPSAEFRSRDAGGRTVHERAFTRSGYYLIFKNGGEPGRSGWSLKLTWGEDAQRKPSGRGRLARPVQVRLYPRGQARRTSPQWAGTELQSAPGRRMGGG